MIPGLNIDAVLGNKHKKVRLLSTSGVSNYFQLYIDDYFYGQLFKKDNEWLASVNDAALEELTYDDIQKLGRLVDDRYKASS